MSTSTKFISSAAVAAPVLSGTAGAMITLLDAVLVTGFGSQVANSIAVAANIATVVCPSAHSQVVGSTASISGATPAGLNGEKRVLSVTTNSYTFAASGIADGLASGTINTRVAPLGWSKPFTGTNLAAYKPLDVAATGVLLRVDDTAATVARVRGQEAMTDINTGVGQFPTNGQQGTPGLFWGKSDSSNATARQWYIIGDNRGFYFLSATVLSDNFHGGYFGDIQSLKSNDPYGAVIFGPSVSRASAAPTTSDSINYSDSARSDSTCMYWARNPNGLGGSSNCFKEAALAGTADYFSGTSSVMPYPSQVDNGLILVQPRVIKSGVGIRGTMPGLYFCTQPAASSFPSETFTEGNNALSGAKLVSIRTGSSAAPGVVFFDTTSDWRA